MKSNLNRADIRLLRKIQKELIAAPARFHMRYGIISSDQVSMLEKPVCGTACCIAGTGYVVATGLNLFDHKNQTRDWSEILDGASEVGVDFRKPVYSKLFYMKIMHDTTHGWPEFYEQAYYDAKTALQRACVGVARIEHFIATDGRE